MSKESRKRHRETQKAAKKSPVLSIFDAGVGMAIFVLVLAAVLVYANSLSGQFVLDDTVIVQGNSSIQALDVSHLKEIFGSHYWKSVETRGGLYRPVVLLSYAVNYALGGEDPEGYHLVNLFVHLGNGILVFFIFERLFHRRTLSFLTALLFILHPIRTEGVASVVGRAESLSAFFLLLAWWAYLQSRRGAIARWLPLSFSSFILACLSKESALSFMALLPLSDLVMGSGTWKERFPLRTTLLRYFPFVAGLGLIFGLRYWVLGGFAPLYINPASNPLVNAGLWTRTLTATHVFGRYLLLLLAPWNLSADYSYNQIPLVQTLLSWRAVWPLLLFLLVAAGTAYSYRRRPALFFSGSFFLATFFLTSNWFRPIGTIMGERLMYFPGLGFNCAVACLICEALDRPRWKSIATGASLALLAFYALRTIDRNLDWRSHYSLFRSAIRTSPDSALVQANYATIMLNERQDARAAIRHARRATEISPDDPVAHYTLGQAYRRAGELENASQAFETVARLAPRTSGGIAAIREQAEIHEALKQFAEAQSDYEKLLAWRPSDAAARSALIRVQENLSKPRN